MEELELQLRASLIELIDNKKVSMLQMAKDIDISYQALRRFVLDQNSNPTASTFRKIEKYLTINV